MLADCGARLAAFASHVVVDEREVFETITHLKEAGATDSLVTEVERIVE